MAFKTYALTDEELRGLANLALQEQGSIDGACAELSLMANLFEQQSNYKTLYDYVRYDGWFYRAAYYMDNGSAGETYRQYARYVLQYGLRTVPAHINEHDCFSDIRSISTGNVRERSAYIRDKTVIKNGYGSTYTFYCFPTSGSDPFGYTKGAKEMSGNLQNIIDKEWELAQVPYVETGNNHQVFSSLVDNVGLAGCQNQAWCATYQFALEVLEFGADQALIHWNMTRDDYCGYSCFETYSKFEAAGKTGSVPKLGALVIFKHSHMGRVLAIDNTTRMFDCGEGNTSNAQYERNGDSCAVKTYSWDDSKILGFCYIDYDQDPAEQYTGTRKIISDGQKAVNKFLAGSGYESLEIDGVFGPKTQRAGYAVLQRAMNLDYDINLEIDGIPGTLTKGALEGHYILYGERQWLVTYAEIACALRGRNPAGIEEPGTYGDGLTKALGGVKFLDDEALIKLLE